MLNIPSILGKSFGVVMVVMALASNVYASSYNVEVKKITAISDTGDVVVLFKPGEKEDGFKGKAKGMLLGTDLGSNKALSVVLSAISLDKEIIIQVESPPTIDFIQVITSTGLAP